MNNIQILEYSKFVRKYIDEFINNIKLIFENTEDQEFLKYKLVMNSIIYNLYSLLDLLDKFSYCINIKAIQVKLNELYSTIIKIIKFISNKLSINDIIFPNNIELSKSEKEEIKKNIIFEKKEKSKLPQKGELKPKPKVYEKQDLYTTSEQQEVEQPISEKYMPIATGGPTQIARGGSIDNTKIKKRIKYLLRKTKKNMLKLQRKTIKK